MSDNTAIKPVLDNLDQLKQSLATLLAPTPKVSVPGRPEFMNQQDVLNENHRMVSELPALKARARGVVPESVLSDYEGKLATCGNDVLERHSLLKGYTGYLATSVIAKATAPARVETDPVEIAVASEPTPIATGEQNYTELCRQHVAANGQTEIAALPGTGEAAARQSLMHRVASEARSEDVTQAGPAEFTDTPTAAASGALPTSRQLTLTERCRVAREAARGGVQMPKLTPAQVAKMNLTELCKAAKTNAPFEEQTDPRYDAYRAGVNQ